MTTDTPQLNDHKQNCGQARAEGKRACIMPSESNFAEGKQEYPPMHSGEFDASPIVMYTSEDNVISLDVKLENETVWLNRAQMSLLFDRDIKTIGKHINNALKEELEGLPVVAKFATTASDGKIYQVEHYNIEMITSVGYRVKSKRGTQFRQWATNELHKGGLDISFLQQNSNISKWHNH